MAVLIPTVYRNKPGSQVYSSFFFALARAAREPDGLIMPEPCVGFVMTGYGPHGRDGSQAQ